MSGAEPAIVLSGLEKSFAGHLGLGRKRAVERLDLTVRGGEIFGLLGPNGAGKTTTFKLILGLLRPDRGEVRLLGGVPSDARVRARVGYLPESPPLYREMTVQSFLCFYARLRGVGKDREAERLDYVLDRCGLDEVAGRIVGNLSKGYRQRVGLAHCQGWRVGVKHTFLAHGVAPWRSSVQTDASCGHWLSGPQNQAAASTPHWTWICNALPKASWASE